ncbi:MAG: phage tail protein [Nitrosomonadales bacterium]|nr:phage tail protein [Nitrosomonadales bacterium]
MKKPADLRKHLEASVPCLRKHPENLHVFVERGNVVSVIGGLSFEYRYSVNLVITDFTDHADTLIIPLLSWIAVNQPDNLQHPDKQEQAIRIEAEIIDHDTVDLSITLDLTERVIVTANPDGSYTATHPEEPALPDLGGPVGWELLINGTPLAQQ